VVELETLNRALRTAKAEKHHMQNDHVGDILFLIGWVFFLFKAMTQAELFSRLSLQLNIQISTGSQKSWKVIFFTNITILQ